MPQIGPRMRSTRKIRMVGQVGRIAGDMTDISS